MVRSAFVIKGPVSPDLFFDRKEVVRFFSRELEVGNYGVLIAIVAPFKFGKSSILLKLHDIAKKYGSVIPVLLRLNIVDAPINAIAEQIGSALGKNFLDSLSRIRRGKYGLYRVFEEINRELEKQNKWVILFIDEFQYLPSLIKAEGFLQNLSDEYIFEFIRGVGEAFRFGLVVSGSIIGDLLDAIDVWHGRFTVFRPRGFPREDSIEMLTKLFRLSGFDVSRDIIEYIAVSMMDHPYHMQLFGHYLVNSSKIDEKTLEEVRRKIQDMLNNYYESKMLDAKSAVPNALDYFRRVLSGLTIEDLSNNELDEISKLERMGYLYRENGTYLFFDPMFERYIIAYLSKRPKEKYIPEYSSEYLVAKELAYREGFREIFISLMSWGAFDILIKRKVGKYNGIGIQVKRTYGEYPQDPQMLEKLKNAAREINVIPILAMIRLPDKRIVYQAPEQNLSSESLKEIINKIQNA